MNAQQELIKEISQESEGKGRYLDSLYQLYQQTKSDRQKLEVAIPLWCVYREYVNPSEFAKYTALPSLEAVEGWTRQFRTFIEGALLKKENSDLKVDFILLQTGFSRIEEGCDFPPFHQLEVDRLDSLQTALYYLNSHLCKSKTSNQSRQYLHLLKKAKAWIPYGRKYWPLLYRINIRFGHLYYDEMELDSAAHCYLEILSRLEETAGTRHYYINGFGMIHSRMTESRAYMNLGLVSDRKGTLLKATDYYAKAIEVFKKDNNPNLLFWPQIRLMNALFDIGDDSSGCAELQSIADRAEEVCRKGQAYNLGHVLGAMSELDLEELRDNADQVDKIFSRALQNAYGQDEQWTLPEEHRNQRLRIRQYSMSISYKLLLDKTLGRPIEGPRVLERIENAIQLHKTLIDTSMESHVAKHHSVLATFLTWKAVLANGSEATMAYNEFLKLAKNDSELLDWPGVIRFASWVMQLHGQDARELQLLELLLPEIEKTKHIIQLGHIYEQMSRVHERIGNFEEALNYKNKFDDLTENRRRLDQYEQLARLDQKLRVSETRREKMELEMQNKDLEDRRWRLRIGIVTVSLVLLLSVFLFSTNRQRILARRKKVEAENRLLERDLELKEAEMQRTTMELLRSNQSFSKLMKDMERLTTGLTSETRKQARSLLIDHKAKAQEDIWRQFNLQFQSHNADFYANLDERFPGLTETEKRICAMHRSGLSSKEIGAVTGQTLNSIYALKSKVRKKLLAADDKALTEILEKL